MWPWGHAAVGYLLYSLWTHGRHRRPPAGTAALVVGFGTQFPDLVDKPLSWTFALLPTGRSLAHSLLTATLVVAVVARLAARRRRSEWAVAFAVGYLSHLFADALWPLLRGEFDKLTYLVWPLLPLPAYDTDPSFLAHFLAFQFDTFTLVEFGIVALALAVWYADGVPGLRRLVPGVDAPESSRTR